MIFPAGALNWSPHIGFLFLHSYWRTVLNDKQANFLCNFDLNFLCFFSHTMCNEFVKEISSSDFWLQDMRHHGLGVRWWLRISWWPWNMYLPTKASRKTLFPFLLVVSSGGICLMCTHDSMSMDLAGLFLPITVSMLCYSDFLWFVITVFMLFLDMLRNEIEVLIFGPPRAVPCTPRDQQLDPPRVRSTMIDLFSVWWNRVCSWLFFWRFCSVSAIFRRTSKLRLLMHRNRLLFIQAETFLRLSLI